MKKKWIAVLSALVLAGACHAGGDTVKDKTAPTAFATQVGCALAPVVTEASPGPCSRCMKAHPCLGRVKEWFCFVPLRTCPCECEHHGACAPPLYLYFLRPCVEGAGCYHYSDKCSSCLNNQCSSCAGSGLGGLFHRDCAGGCASCCDSCK
jgi:hypothetical protein